MGEQDADDVGAPAVPGASVRKVGTLWSTSSKACSAPEPAAVNVSTICTSSNC